MLKPMKIALTAAVMCGGLAASATAAPLSFVTSFDLTANSSVNTNAADTGGLDGASAALTFNFADMTSFDGGIALAETAFLTVSGATNPASNGVFAISDPVGVSIIGPAGLSVINNSFFGPLSAAFEVPDVFSKVRFDAEDTIDAVEGDLLTADILNGIEFSFGVNTSSSQLTSAFNSQTYNANNITTLTVGADLAPVPLPAALPLLLVGLGGLGVMGRRRKTA